MGDADDRDLDVRRAVAAHLRHLQSHHQLVYLPTPPTLERPAPIAPHPERRPPAEPAKLAQSVPPQSPQGAPPAGRAATPGRANPGRGGGEGQDVEAARKREIAQSWTPAQKLHYLRDRNVGDCRRCALCETRNSIVFGVGNPSADLMFVGEAPGADEDRQGEPFVGRAGQRLTRWIEALGLTRDDVYIANVLKCRPPGNRDPRPEEVDRCSPFLQAQVRAIGPKIIVALGRHAGMLLSRREDMSLRAMRNTRMNYVDPKTKAQTPLMVTYHPAYVLRQERGRPDDNDADGIVMGDLRRALEVARSAR